MTVVAAGNPGVPDLIPARMLNEFAYCPRLAYLEWSQGEWEESGDTVDGSRIHRRVNRAEGPRAVLHQRSIELSSARLGLIAVIDLIESSGGGLRPVDYKRGKKPAVAEGAWEPERVQLCAQGLLLREHGHRSPLAFFDHRHPRRVLRRPREHRRSRHFITHDPSSIRSWGGIFSDHDGGNLGVLLRGVQQRARNPAGRPL
jgi:CRISPR-associated protein Cas4